MTLLIASWISQWSFAASLPIVLLGLLVWAGGGWLWLLHCRRSGWRRSVLFLEGCRFLLITLVTFTLLRPEFLWQLEREESPKVALLFDETASMQTRDVVSSNQVIQRAEWVSRQRESEFWKPIQETGDVAVVQRTFGEHQAETNTASLATTGTDLNRALVDTLHQVQQLKAVLLMTDGDWNVGQSPVAAATSYRQNDIPIFSVAVGSQSPLPDLTIESVDVPAYGLLGEQVSIPFTISSHLSRSVETEVELTPKKGETVKKSVTIPAGETIQESVVWSPRSVGEQTLTLKLPVQEEEALSDNNEKRFRINVRVETLNVLVVDSKPRWEYRYLRNALARDPGVDLHCLLFHPRIGMGGGRHYLSSFPGTKQMLSRYDVVFLGDVGIGQGELTRKDAKLLSGLVSQQGSGLVFLPGPRGRHLTWRDSPLGELMPVMLNTNKPSGIGLSNETRLALTSAGKEHWLTRLSGEDNPNSAVWQQLPGFYWCSAVKKSRPGSTVLAVHSSLRNKWGRLPLLVTRSYGNGNVLFMGTDSAWRWRRGVEDKYHYRFWSQVVRWMAHQRHLAGKEGIRLSFNPESPTVGDTMFLQATVLNDSGFPIQSGSVTGVIDVPGKPNERLEFSPVDGGWGVYKTKFVPEVEGDYKIQVTSPEHDRELTSRIEVRRPNIEKQGQPINAEVLSEMARLTHGVAVGTHEVNRAVEAISLLPEPRPLEKRIRLWSHPLWGGLLLLLLAVYWTGRKLAGMI